MGEVIEKERIKSEFKNIRINIIIILPPIDIIYDLSMITLGTFFTSIGDLKFTRYFAEQSISMMLLNLEIGIDMDTVYDPISYLRTVKIKINII